MEEGKHCGNDETNDSMNRFKEEIIIKEKLEKNLEEDIKTLKTIRHDVGEKLKEYEKELPDFESKKNEIADYVSMKGPMIDSAVKDKKAALDNKIKEYDAQITTLEKEIDEWITKKIPAAQMESNSAKTKSVKAKEDFEKKEEDIIKLKDKINVNIEMLGKLKKTIEAAEETKEPDKTEKMYMQMNQLKKELEGTILNKVEVLVAELYQKYKESDIAETEFYNKDEILQNIKLDVEAKEKKLENLKKNRLSSLLKTIGK